MGIKGLGGDLLLPADTVEQSLSFRLQGRRCNLSVENALALAARLVAAVPDGRVQLDKLIDEIARKKKP